MLTRTRIADLDSVPRQRRGCSCRVLDDEAVLYDVAHGTVHYLNRTASFLWNQCNGRRRIRDVAEVMARTFNMDDRQQLLTDVQRAISELADNGLIDLAQPADA